MSNRSTVITIWTLALACCVFIVKGTSIGPVIFVISDRFGMGVHIGDLLVIIPLAFAAFLTVVVTRPDVDTTDEGGLLDEFTG